MKPVSQILKGATWTVGAYGLIVLLRFGTNVVLARLLTPEIFGVMVVVNSLQTGLALMLDVGIGQNIIQNVRGLEARFYNTAWTIQAARGLVLAVIALLAAAPLAALYEEPLMTPILAAMSLNFIVNGLMSTAPFLLERQFELVRRNVFEFIVELASAVVFVGLALISPTIWSLVLGGVAATIIRTAVSHMILRNASHKFFFCREDAASILSFGKWIFLGAMLHFGANNIDRLLLGDILALKELGVYGIAASLAGYVGNAFARLGGFVVFPLLAGLADTPRQTLRCGINRLRFRFLLLAASLVTGFIVCGDVLIRHVYDARYQDAEWMLPVFLCGTWISLMCSINDAVLLGVGKPQYGTFANGLKLAFLVFALPMFTVKYGLVGAAVTVAAGEIFRYTALLVGQVKARLAFARQDALATAFLILCTLLAELLRSYIGWGTSFDALFSQH